MCTSGGTITRAAKISIMVLVCSLTAHAYGFAGGTGEPNDPYQIATLADLLAVGSSTELLSKHYILVNDLDLDPNLPGGRVFDKPLIAAIDPNGVTEGPLFPFAGVLDGRGHTIHNLRISREQGFGTGLIGRLSGVVKDLHVRDVRIHGMAAGALVGFNNGGAILRCTATGQVSGSLGTGGLVGDLSRGVLSDCQAEVQVRGAMLVGGLFGSANGGMAVRCEAKGDVWGERYVGGLGGDLMRCTITDSRAEGIVAGVQSVGGLIGRMNFSTMVLRCGALCDVTAERTAGGLVGEMSFGTLLMDCYARGSVAGSRAGGLVGEFTGAQILNSYAACRMIPVAYPEGTPAVAGGLFGEAGLSSASLAVGNFWDTEVAEVGFSSGQGRQYPNAGLATEQMQQQAAFEQAGWDFASTWAMSEGGYPVLQWELAGN